MDHARIAIDAIITAEANGISLSHLLADLGNDTAASETLAYDADMANAALATPPEKTYVAALAIKEVYETTGGGDLCDILDAVLDGAQEYENVAVDARIALAAIEAARELENAA